METENNRDVISYHQGTGYHFSKCSLTTRANYLKPNFKTFKAAKSPLPLFRLWTWH